MSMENVLIELNYSEYPGKTVLNPSLIQLDVAGEGTRVYSMFCNDLDFTVKESYDSIVTALEKAGFGIIRITD